MLKRNRPLILRLLLVVLLATFLSPNFAWQTVASHSAVAHADVGIVAEHVGHHHEVDVHHQDQDDAAHGQIGHLISHLPAVMSGSTPLPSLAAARIAYPAREHSFAHADPEPPFKPPRDLLFA